MLLYTVLAATPGNLFNDFQVVVIGTTAASPCSPSGSSAALSSSSLSIPQATDTTTSGSTSIATSNSTEIANSSSSPAAIPALPPLNYVQTLQTTCGTSIVLSYSSIISLGTTTSFPTVGCSSPGSSPATSSVQGCHSGYSTFSVASNSSVCCPSAQQTSSLDVMYCFTSASASSSGTSVVRAVEDSTTSTASRSTAAPTVVVISNIVFTQAGTATSGDTSLLQFLLSMPTCFVVAIVDRFLLNL